MTAFHALRMVGVASLASCALFGCSSPQNDWNKASAENTVAGYQRFIKAHPGNELAVRAQSRIDALRDEQAWDAALRGGTLPALQQYLRSEPYGAHVQECNDRMTGLQRAQAWKAAAADGTAPALQAFLQKFPTGPEADEARTRLAGLQSEQYRVQVASFRSERAANHALRRLRSRYAKVLHDISVDGPAGKERLTTIQSGQMSRAGAEAACRTIRKEHHVCEVVHANLMG